MKQITDNQIAGFLAWRVSSQINSNDYRSLIASCGGPAALLSDLPKNECWKPLTEKLRLPAYREEARRTLKHWREQGIGVLVLGEAPFPEELLHISDPPILLTYRGNWSEAGYRCPRLSVVGSRRADSEGIDIAHHFGKVFTQNGVCIVSGLALGIDGAAHRGAIRGATGSVMATIAVCGNGLSQVYPRTHRDLAAEILDRGGVLLSQFDPEEPPYPVNFLNRNRIIAALSLGTLVIQASDKSGSLVTARYALEYGKELFIVPGSIKDPRYQGSNRLLQHGAHLVTSPEDMIQILPELARREEAVPVAEQGFSIPEELRWIVSLLSNHQTLHIEDAQRQAPSPATFYQQLLMLELDGIIERQPGNMLALSTEKRLQLRQTG